VGEVTLTHAFYDPEQFDKLVPMGRMWASHVTPVDHMYVTLAQERERDWARMPAAGRVVSVQRFPNDQSPFWDESVKEPDYRVIVAHSCTVFSIFIHVGELAPEVAAAVGEIAPGQSWHALPGGPAVEIEAGGALARFGGSSFDYSLHDADVTLSGFQVPEHYEGEAWKVHTVDPFDYMTPELAGALLAKSPRRAEPLGGKIDYDVPGTLAGNWFLDGTAGYAGGGVSVSYWEGHLAIAYDHIDPDQVRVAIGRDVGITFDECRACGGVYAVAGNGPDPASVTAADGVIKYELTGRQGVFDDPFNERTVSDGNLLGTLLLQVIDSASIRMEFFYGISADSVGSFTDDTLIYRR
jgi:hypothetical protein